MPDVRVVLSAFSRCSLAPFGDPPASLITRYLGNSGFPHVCAAVRVGGCLSVNYDSSCSVQSGYPHTPVWGTPTHICYLPVCLSFSSPVAPSLVSLSIHPPLALNSFLSLFCCPDFADIWLNVMFTCCSLCLFRAGGEYGN